MKLEQPQPIRKPLPLTPLVDVVFLLLMFFMLTSNFTRFGSVKLDFLRSSTAKTSTSAPSNGLIIRVGEGLDIRVNGRSVALSQLAATLNTFTDRGFERAALVATPDATVQDLVTVLETARTSTLKTIVIAK
jgi:biopolymer transport protein ExbD